MLGHLTIGDDCWVYFVLFTLHKRLVEARHDNAMMKLMIPLYNLCTRKVDQSNTKHVYAIIGRRCKLPLHPSTELKFN